MVYVSENMNLRKLKKLVVSGKLLTLALSNEALTNSDYGLTNFPTFDF